MPRRNHTMRRKIRVDKRRYLQLERIALTRLILNFEGQNLLNLNFENIYLIAKYSQSSLDEIAQLTAGLIQINFQLPNGEILRSNIHLEREYNG